MYSTEVWGMRLKSYSYCVTVLSVFFAALSIYTGTLRSSATLLRDALHNVLRGPSSFFDTVPIGRILSRFSGDVDTMDSRLPMSIGQWLPCCSRVRSCNTRTSTYLLF